MCLRAVSLQQKQPALQCARLCPVPQGRHPHPCQGYCGWQHAHMLKKKKCWLLITLSYNMKANRALPSCSSSVMPCIRCLICLKTAGKLLKRGLYTHCECSNRGLLAVLQGRSPACKPGLLCVQCINRLTLFQIDGNSVQVLVYKAHTIQRQLSDMKHLY